jgi:hypothetical protein
MAKFVEFTNTEKRPVLVNVDKIVYIHKPDLDNEGTTICFEKRGTDVQAVIVEESYDNVKKKLLGVVS